MYGRSARLYGQLSFDTTLTFQAGSSVTLIFGQALFGFLQKEWEWTRTRSKIPVLYGRRIYQSAKQKENSDLYCVLQSKNRRRTTHREKNFLSSHDIAQETYPNQPSTNRSSNETERDYPREYQRTTDR